jgi:hypothetical protein
VVEEVGEDPAAAVGPEVVVVGVVEANVVEPPNAALMLE